MRIPTITDNWGLKVLSLVLAIVTYYALKSDNSRSGDNHDKRIIYYP